MGTEEARVDRTTWGPDDLLIESAPVAEERTA